MSYTYIKTNKELLAYLAAFEDKKPHIVALDLEAELNLHAYGERLCLVQIYDGVESILIDPFEINNQCLKKLFESKNVLKVMYDASSDLALMKNGYDIEIKSILDLRPAIDLLEYKARNLHSVIEHDLGIALKDKTKFQRYNWTRRPIDKRAIEYALNDVLYMLRLKDIILERLAAAGMMEIFFLKNLQIQGKDYKRNPKEQHRKTSGYHALAEDEKAVFRLLYNVREKYARMLNMPSHNVVANSSLIKLAQDGESLSELKFPRRLSSNLVEEIKRELRAGLKR